MTGGKIKKKPKTFTFGKDVQTSDVFYQHVVELTPEAVVIHSNGKIVYANPAAFNLIQVKNAQDIIGQSVMKFVHPESLPLIQSRIKQMLSKGQVAPFVEEKFITLNGDIIYAETKAVPFTFKGKPAILAILRDITKKKKLEEKQKFLEEVRVLLNTSADYKTTLKNICKLLVPFFADYIRIVLINEEKKIEEVVAYHSDPKKIALVKRLYDVYKDKSRVTHGVPNILISGKSEIIEHLKPQFTGVLKNNKDVNSITEQLGLTSYIGVPLKVNNRVIGVITFSSADTKRIYNREDLKFAEDIASRIAYAVDNALLFNNIQKELGERLKAQADQALLASYLDQTFDAMILWKLDGNIVYWNKGAEELYGYSKEEAIGKKTHTLLKTKHPIPFSKIKSILFNTGRWEGELIHVSKDNKPLTLSCKKILITEKDGTSYILETNRDITQRLLFEKNLEFLSESSKIFATSLDFKTTLRNIAKLAVPHIADWCSVEMKTEKGIEQLAVAHIDPKKVKWAKELNKSNPSNPESQTGVPNVIRTGKSEFYPKVSDEMLVQGARNKRELALLRNLLLSSAMIIPISTKKESIGAITFISAESGRTYTKSDLAIAEELAARAGLAIENSQLYTDAQQAIRIRDEFISLASHELKTPITSLKIYAQSLRKRFEESDHALSLFFVKMDEQTDRLALLVNDLLNISKIQHGKLEFNWENADLNAIVKETVKLLQGTVMKHKIIIKGEIDKKVYADPYRLYQVVTNLLTNAAKYSPKADKVVIHMTSNKNNAKVTIQDFGIGIKSTEQKKIFSQFYRVNNPNEKKFPGLGMGLFISKEIIERHRGKMSVKSVKGKGSQFSFIIPFDRVLLRKNQ